MNTVDLTKPERLAIARLVPGCFQISNYLEQRHAAREAGDRLLDVVEVGPDQTGRTSDYGNSHRVPRLISVSSCLLAMLPLPKASLSISNIEAAVVYVPLAPMSTGCLRSELPALS